MERVLVRKIVVSATVSALLGGVTTVIGAAPSSAGPTPTVGEITQKAGTAGCFTYNGSGGACSVGRAIGDGLDVAVSPDGKNVYVAGYAGDGIAIMDRNTTTGTLSQSAATDGCVSWNGQIGNTGPVVCVSSPAMFLPIGVTVSPDGKNVYAASRNGNTINILDRNTTTGDLSPKAGTAGCISDDGTDGLNAGIVCQDGVALRGATAVKVTADGKHVYAISQFGDAVNIFDRSTATGALVQKTGTAGCISRDGTDGIPSSPIVCQIVPTLDQVFDVEISHDDKTVYTTALLSKAVTVFDRNTSTGALTRKAGTAGCISHDGTDATPSAPVTCQVSATLDRANTVTLSPDDKNVYVTAFTSDSVTIFDRNTSTGALTRKVGIAGCISETGNSGACQDGVGIDGPRDITISDDGLSAYVAAELSDSISVHDRNPTTGALTPKAGTAGCVSETGTGGACVDGRALITPVAVAVSPDGKNLYGGSFDSDALTVFDRSSGVCTTHPFSDVPTWLTDSVNWSFCGSYLAGYPDGTFKQQLNMTRAQVANLLYGVAGSPDVSGSPAHGLSDVPNWVNNAVTWLVENDYMSGYPDDTFKPNLPISRGQVTRATFRVQGSPPGAPAHSFPDVPNWLTDAVNWATNDPDGGGPLPALMAGFPDGRFKPDDNITRGQTTRLTCRANAAPGTC